jgi:hypothetical protein
MYPASAPASFGIPDPAIVEYAASERDVSVVTLPAIAIVVGTFVNTWVTGRIAHMNWAGVVILLGD